MNDELLNAIRLIMREELAKERQLTRAEMRELRDDLRQEMHEGFGQLDKRIDLLSDEVGKFRLEMRFRLKNIAETLEDHDARLNKLDERVERLEHPRDDDDNGNGKPE